MIYRPICPCCSSLMVDYKRPVSSNKPRFVCTNPKCKKRLIRDGGSYFFEVQKYRTALYSITHLKNYSKYREAEATGKIERIETKD